MPKSYKEKTTAPKTKNKSSQAMQQQQGGKGTVRKGR